MDLKAYLAKNYGAGDRKSRKKRSIAPKKVPKNAALARIIDETDDWKEAGDHASSAYQTNASRIKLEVDGIPIDEMDELEGQPILESVKDLSWKSDNWIRVEDDEPCTEKGSLDIDEEDSVRDRRVYSDDDGPQETKRIRAFSDEEEPILRNKNRRTPTPSPPPNDSSMITKSHEASKSLDRTMSDGTFAGLQSLASYSSQLESAVLEKQALIKSSQTSGNNAETIYRDKMGRVIDLKALEQAENEKKILKEKIEAERSIFKYGIKQMTDAKRLRERLEDESQSLTIGRDNRLRNEIQKAEQRWGDPMAHLIKSKNASSLKNDLPVRPICPHAAQPNRYGIKPGYRWDGVDRSNGFEAKIFLARNSRAALEHEAYKWSTEDM